MARQQSQGEAAIRVNTRVFCYIYCTNRIAQEGAMNDKQCSFHPHSSHMGLVGEEPHSADAALIVSFKFFFKANHCFYCK